MRTWRRKREEKKSSDSREKMKQESVTFDVK